jgi:hypothetical protein
MEFLTAIIPIIAALITTVVMSGIKKGVDFVDTLSAPVQQLLVGVISFAVVKLSDLTAVPLASDPGTWSSATVAAVIIALMAMGMHAVRKQAVVPSEE